MSIGHAFTMSHGWPFPYLVRLEVARSARSTNPWTLCKGVVSFAAESLLLNTGVFLVLGCALSRCCQAARGFHGRLFQISLAHSFYGVALASVVMSEVAQGLGSSRDREQLLQLFATDEPSLGGPLWLEQVLGKEIFWWRARVEECYIAGDKYPFADAEFIARILRLEKLRFLHLSGYRISSDALNNLKTHPELRAITLVDCDSAGNDYLPLLCIRSHNATHGWIECGTCLRAARHD